MLWSLPQQPDHLASVPSGGVLDLGSLSTPEDMGRWRDPQRRVFPAVTSGLHTLALVQTWQHNNPEPRVCSTADEPLQPHTPLVGLETFPAMMPPSGLKVPPALKFRLSARPGPT